METHLLVALLLMVTFIWIFGVAIIYLYKHECPWYLLLPVFILVGIVIYITTVMTLNEISIVIF